MATVGMSHDNNASKTSIELIRIADKLRNAYSFIRRPYKVSIFLTESSRLCN